MGSGWNPLVPTNSISLTALYSTKQVLEVQETLFTNLDTGLTTVEALARARRVGQNELERGEKENLWMKMFNQFKDPMILLLLGSAGISVFMGQFDDAVSITLVRMVNGENFYG